MRNVLASINYVIEKLEEKNLYKLAQNGHDIFAAMYSFVGDGDGNLNISENVSDEDKKKYYESASPEGSFEYDPLDKTRQTKWRVKSEVDSEYAGNEHSTPSHPDHLMLTEYKEPIMLTDNRTDSMPDEIDEYEDEYNKFSEQDELDSFIKDIQSARTNFIGDPEGLAEYLEDILTNKNFIRIMLHDDFNMKARMPRSIELLAYPGTTRIGLKIDGEQIVKPRVTVKSVLSMTNSFISKLENYGLKREAEAMHDVFIKVANAYDLVNRPGVSVQAKKWIQDNVANIDAMTNIQLINMMASLPLNVQTELKQIITQYKSTQGYKQNKPMGYQQPNQQGYQQPYQQGYQQGYQQQNMYGNQGGMVRPQ